MIASLYIRIAGYALLAGLLFAGGWKTGASHWQGRYATLERQGWQQRAQDEEAARKAVERQLADTRDIVRNNAEVLADVQSTTAAIVADRDRLRSLLSRASRPRPTSDPVPQASDRPAAPEAPGAQSDGRLDGLLADAITECRGNDANHSALIAELIPQL